MLHNLCFEIFEQIREPGDRKTELLLWKILYIEQKGKT